MIQISVIVPIYNTEKYLRECLDSLTRQGFTKDNAEVLLINDGSTDGSANIVAEYCAKYDFFHLINKENGGLVSARNCGLEHASGEFVAFVDSDDFVAEYIYFPIIDLIEKNNLQILYFGYTKNKELLESFDKSFYIVNRNNSVKQSSCRMVYRRDLILLNSLSFDTKIKRYCEDFLFNYKYVINCDLPVGGNPKPLYYYRTTANSITDNIAKHSDDAKSEYYDSTLYVCSEIKRYGILKNKQSDPAYVKCLSQAVMIFLWGAMIFKINPIKALKDLEENDVSTRDIHNLAFEGRAFKYKIKSFLEFLFRFKILYVVVCFVYKLIK